MENQLTSGLIAEVKRKATTSRAEAETLTFPVHAFPPVLQNIITRLNECLGYPTDYTAAAALAAISIATGNTNVLKVKEGWITAGNLWIAITGRTGENKSHPLKKMLQPIFDRDIYHYTQYRAELKEWHKLEVMDKKERELLGYSEMPAKPVHTKSIITDFTPEALAMVLEGNPRGIGVYRDELSGWVKDFGRYAKSGEQENWLSMFDRETINIDRKGGGSIYIPCPFVTVVGTIQKKILSELAKDGRGDNGFIDRFLFVLPEDMKAAYFGDTDLDPAVTSDWNNIVNRLLDIPATFDDYGRMQSNTLTYSPEAKELYIEWNRATTDQLNNSEDDSVRGMLAKANTYIHRFALISQMLMYATHTGDNRQISGEAMVSAVLIADYFKATALKAVSIIHNTNPIATLPESKKILYAALPDKVFLTGEAIDIMLRMGERVYMSKPTLTGWLNDTTLFIKHSHGKYEKAIAA